MDDMNSFNELILSTFHQVFAIGTVYFSRYFTPDPPIFEPQPVFSFCLLSFLLYFASDLRLHERWEFFNDVLRSPVKSFKGGRLFSIWVSLKTNPTLAKVMLY